MITPVEFLETRFNASLRQLFAWAGIPVKIFDDALKVFATALILSAGVGVDLKLAIIVCGFVTVTYTLLGGLWALVVTDYVQFLMKIAAMVLLLPLAIWRVGGPASAFTGLPPHFLNLTGGPYGWAYLFEFYSAHQHQLQRDLGAGPEIIFRTRRALGEQSGIPVRRVKLRRNPFDASSCGNRPQVSA